MWRYHQSTGILEHGGEVESAGYSGHAQYKNDPLAQAVHNQGPIPRGRYRIGNPCETREHGPFVLPLSPNMDNKMCGRSGFLIHGDSLTAPGEASQGCIILSRETRERIAASLDNELEVVE